MPQVPESDYWYHAILAAVKSYNDGWVAEDSTSKETWRKRIEHCARELIKALEREKR